MMLAKSMNPASRSLLQYVIAISRVIEQNYTLLQRRAYRLMVRIPMSAFFGAPRKASPTSVHLMERSQIRRWTI
jgi:hypothetical protein